MREIEFKNAIAQKVLSNRLAAVGNSEEEADVNLQPEAVPDVKSIMEKELDQKLREACVEPQQVDPIGGNTIPPYYSREVSRYEPPIPVQEKKNRRP